MYYNLKVFVQTPWKGQIMRVQFTVNDKEWEKLMGFAKEKGYPDVPSYCKDASLKERSYATMWKTVVKKISEMPSGTKFALRDLIQTPPSNLGVKLYNHQEELKITVNDQKDSLKTNTFTKL